MKSKPADAGSAAATSTCPTTATPEMLTAGADTFRRIFGTEHPPPVVKDCLVEVWTAMLNAAPAPASQTVASSSNDWAR